MTAALASMVRCLRLTAGRERRIWMSLIGMTTVFLTGTLLRAVWLIRHQFDSAQDPLVGLARWGILLLLVPAAVMFSQSSGRNRLTELRSSLDALAMMVGVSALTFYMVLMPRRVPMPFAVAATDRFVLALIPTTALCAAVYGLVFRRRPFAAWRSCITVGLFAGLLSITVHDISIIAFGATVDNATRSGAGDGMMIASYLLLALAGVYRLVPDSRQGEKLTDREASPVWTGLLGSALSLAGLLVLLKLAMSAGTGTERVFAAASMGLVALVIVGKEAVIASENHVLAADAMVDPVTGLFSRRRFMDSLPREVRRALNEDAPLALCVIDIIDLAAVNNAYGYAAGDAGLRRIGERLSGAYAGLAVAARIGGDQLALLLPSTSADEARDICREILADISGATDETGALRLAIGVAEVPRHAADVERLMYVATGAAYWSASMSEQDVVVYDPLLVDVFDHAAHIARLEKNADTKAVKSLAAAVDARDHNTRHHSQNTADLAVLLAELTGLSQQRAEMVHVAGLLHDVGKIGIPDKVLLKAGKLTPDEMRQIREHPALGERIMRSAVDPEILSWIRAHHERWDGNGYPDELAGESIPLEARILAVCDSFDAMRSDRSYRKGMSIEEALSELRACAGSQFDPALVDFLTEAVCGHRKSWFEQLAHPGREDDARPRVTFEVVGNLPG